MCIRVDFSASRRAGHGHEFALANAKETRLNAVVCASLLPLNFLSFVNLYQHKYNQLPFIYVITASPSLSPEIHLGFSQGIREAGLDLDFFWFVVIGHAYVFFFRHVQ